MESSRLGRLRRESFMNLLPPFTRPVGPGFARKPLAVLWRRLSGALVLVVPALVFGSAASLFAQAAPFDLSRQIATLGHPSPVLDLPAGTHRIPASGLKLEGLGDVVIDGHGSTLIAINRAAPALRIDGCHGVTLRNFQIDYDPLPFTQGDVQSVDAPRRAVTVRLHAGYPGLEVLAEPKGGLFPDARLQVFASGRLKPGAPDYHIESAESAGDRLIRIHLPAWQIGLDQIAAGDAVTISSRAAECIAIRDSQDVVLENVTIWSSPNLGVLVRSCGDGGVYRGLKIVPGPIPPGATEPRLMSACADGLNVASTRKGPLVDHCEFSFLGDDAVNLHGTMVPVLQWLDDHTFLAGYPWHSELLDRIVRSGDPIRFLAPPSYRIAAGRTVADVVPVAEDPQKWASALGKIWPMITVQPDRARFYRVTLSEPLPAAAASLFAEFPATATPGYVIRDSRFHDHRGRGLRIMASDGVIAGNQFERIKGSAISLGPELGYWRESGWVENVTVARNRITDVGQGLNIQLPSSYSMGAICVMARQDEEGSFPGNRNLLIADNVIDGCSVAGISVSNAANVQISGNTIRRVQLTLQPDAGREFGLFSRDPISVIRADAEVTNNIISPHESPKTSRE